MPPPLGVPWCDWLTVAYLIVVPLPAGLAAGIAVDAALRIVEEHRRAGDD